MIQHPSEPMEVARRLLAYVVRDAQRPEDLADAAEVAYRRLRERLGLLLGRTGFDALWARALLQAERKAGTRSPGAHGRSPSASEGALHALVDGQDAAATRDRLIAVFGACIALLYTFIGQDLSFRLVQQIWPDVPLGEPQVRGEEATV